MKKFIVCTDSGCDLPLHVLQENDIHPLKLIYEVNGEVVTDSMLHEDCHQFYEDMRAGAAPKTSLVNMVRFMDFWRPLLEQKLPIIHISLGSGVSGTFNNGVMAIEALKEEFPDSEIHIIDSTLCSVGYGMLSLQAAKMRDEGAEVQEAIDWLEANKGRINTWYTTDELKYLYRSGRVSKFGAMFGTALNICPILNLDLEGHLIVQERVRGFKSTLKRITAIVEETVEDPQDQVLYFCHSDVPERAKAYGDELKEKFGFKDVYYTYIGPTIGANCGPGLIAPFYFGKLRNMKGYVKEG